jgi:hypothetical protein
MKRHPRLVYPPRSGSQSEPDGQVMLPPHPTYNCYLHYPPVESVWIRNAAGTAWVCEVCHSPAHTDVLSASGARRNAPYREEGE